MDNNDIYAIKVKTIDGSWWDLDIDEITTGPCGNSDYSDYTICRRIQGLAMVRCKKSSENICRIENNIQNNVNIPYTYYIYSENIIAVKIMRFNANE